MNLQRFSEEDAHPVGRIPLSRREDMRVDVGRGRKSRMAENLLYHARGASSLRSAPRGCTNNDM